jgi:hypothetical protein
VDVVCLQEWQAQGHAQQQQQQMTAEMLLQLRWLVGMPEWYQAASATAVMLAKRSSHQRSLLRHASSEQLRRGPSRGCVNQQLKLQQHPWGSSKSVGLMRLLHRPSRTAPAVSSA